MNGLLKPELTEKCGVVGIWTKDTLAPYFARRALASLQHRGQESSGMSVVNSKGKITTYKGMGLVPHVLTEKALEKLGIGHVSIGQNRYGTFGASSPENAQPITVKEGKYEISLGHNGNIPDVENIEKDLGVKQDTLGDTMLMTHLITKQRAKHDSWQTTLQHTLPLFQGAYCLIILTNDGSLIGTRDPYGIRPFCLGKFEDGWIMASESAALDTIGAEFVREILPGEIIEITKEGEVISSFFGESRRKKFCIFENIYFMRPDSFLNGQRVRAGRELSGKLLGQRIRAKKLKPEVVVPTFDSGYPAAKGVAKELQLPIVDAITTSHYVGRTFIQPGQSNRVIAVNGKHNIVPDEIIGKRVVIVDDSAVRLTTSTALAKKFHEAGAKEVIFAFASPPVVAQCDLGIDMRNKKQLPAAQFKDESFETIEANIAAHVDADAVVYLPIEQTAEAMNGTPDDFYYYPFGGPHPIRDKQEIFPQRKQKLTGKPKIAIFLSGKGTYVQDIIDGIANGTIDAEISGITTNNSDAYGITRAKEHNIPTHVLPFTGKRTDKRARLAYEQELVEHIKKQKPDILFLSGWQMILGDTFLKSMQELQIPVFNHHPALLSSDNSDTVATSHGFIPVLRGSHVGTDAFEKKLHVSGITVHQVLPGDGYDIGPVVMRAEVAILSGDTIESYQNNMQETEHLLVPTAIKRILHVVKQNIDVSQGKFPW